MQPTDSYSASPLLSERPDYAALGSYGNGLDPFVYKNLTEDILSFQHNCINIHSTESQSLSAWQKSSNILDFSRV